MSKKKSFFLNFSTNSLFLVLEENVNVLASLEVKLNNNYNMHLKHQIKMTELVIKTVKKEIINRYLKEDIPLNKIANLVLSSDGIKKLIYQELFTLRVIEKDEMISLDVLERVINSLDIDELSLIIRDKNNSVYRILALKRYDEIIFDVDNDVYEEMVMKKRLDRRG